jgi:hypothetical protein
MTDQEQHRVIRVKPATPLRKKQHEMTGQQLDLLWKRRQCPQDVQPNAHILANWHIREGKRWIIRDINRDAPTRRPNFLQAHAGAQPWQHYDDARRRWSICDFSTWSLGAGDSLCAIGAGRR